jgi:hypothetical protein
MNTTNDIAHDGALWVCMCCGRHDKDRSNLYARGCGTHAVEVEEKSIVYEDGTPKSFVVNGKAYNKD